MAKTHAVLEILVPKSLAALSLLSEVHRYARCRPYKKVNWKLSSYSNKGVDCKRCLKILKAMPKALR